MSTYYDILEIDPSADVKSIRQAYLKLSLKHHPDKNPDNKEAAKARFCAIGQAYEVLSNPTERSNYDRELRQRGKSSRPSSTAFSSSQSSHSYESYQDAFDATVAGMSEEELAVAIGAISVVAGIVGSIVASRLLSGSSAPNSTSRSAAGSAASSFLSSAGSLVGSMVASHAAAEAARTLHSQAVDKIAYKEEVQRCAARGEPMPQPPPKAKWEDTFQRAMGSMMNSANSSGSSSTTNRDASSSTSTSQQQQQQQQRPAWQSKVQSAVDAAKTKAATVAAKHMAEAFIQKAAQEMKKGAR